MLALGCNTATAAPAFAYVLRAQLKRQKSGRDMPLSGTVPQHCSWEPHSPSNFLLSLGASLRQRGQRLFYVGILLSV